MNGERAQHSALCPRRAWWLLGASAVASRVFFGIFKIQRTPSLPRGVSQAIMYTVGKREGQRKKLQTHSLGLGLGGKEGRGSHPCLGVSGDTLPSA